MPVRGPTRTNCKDDALFPRPPSLDLVAGTVTIGMQADLACKQMRYVAGMNRERLGAAFGSLELLHIADSSCGGDSRLRPDEGAT